MPKADLTCSEVLKNAEAARRAALARFQGEELQSELDKADNLIERARNREDCI